MMEIALAYVVVFIWQYIVLLHYCGSIHYCFGIWLFYCILFLGCHGSFLFVLFGIILFEGCLGSKLILFSIVWIWYVPALVMLRAQNKNKLSGRKEGHTSGPILFSNGLGCRRFGCHPIFARDIGYHLFVS
jgi:hypothetical protein